MIPKRMEWWLDENGFGKVESSQAVRGGCINHGVRLSTTTGDKFFLKTNLHCPVDMFACEVSGLKSLIVPGGPKVPEPYLHGADFLLMEDLAPARPAGDYWETFGFQMAVLHNHTVERFGFEGDNYIGSTPQPNGWTEDGFRFYAEHRLGFQAQLAAQRGLLAATEADRIISLSQRLEDLIPAQPASILHGDLWSGNAISDSTGQPAIIDPAAYYGWAEADLAMMVLFGSPAERFWLAYTEARPLEQGWRDRFALYNLYHWLNHLNLFGRSYYSQVMHTVQNFAGKGKG